MLDRTVIPNPATAISAKENFKLNNSAINPINGGPSKNPKNEIVDTKASATLGEYNLDRPAMLYESGIIEATPSPTNKNPKVEATIVGNITAITKCN